MHVNLTSLQDNIVHHYKNISLFLIGWSPLANSSQPAGFDQGPICTGEKAVLDKFSVITNALQMQMFVTILQIWPQIARRRIIFKVFKGNKIT